MIKEILKQNWFRIFMVIAILAHLALFALGKYIEVKDHNFAVMQIASSLCEGIDGEEEMKDCITPILVSEYIKLPFFKIPMDGKE